MTTTGLYLVGCGLCSASATVLASSETLTPPQQWTVLALLAAVVLGVGGHIAMSMNKLAAANAEQAKQTALMLQQMQNDRAESVRVRGEQFAAVHDRFDRLPEDVANEIDKRRD